MVTSNKPVILAHLGFCRGEIGEARLAVDRICEPFLYSVSVVVATAAGQYQGSAGECGLGEPGSGNHIWCGSSVTSRAVCDVMRIIPPEVTVIVGKYLSRLGHDPHLPYLLSELLRWPVWKMLSRYLCALSQRWRWCNCNRLALVEDLSRS